MKLPATKFIRTLILFAVITSPAFTQVPRQIQYQGRVATAEGGAWGGTEGYFAFALVQGATVLWNNWEGTANPSDPGAISLGTGQVLTLTVSQGVFSIRLGEGSDTNEQILPPVFFDPVANSVRTGVKLAVWFSPSGSPPFTRLSPDVEFTSVPYAMVSGIAETVQDRSITNNKLAVVGPNPATDFQVSNAMLADNAVTNPKIAPLSVDWAKRAVRTIRKATAAGDIPSAGVGEIAISWGSGNYVTTGINTLTTVPNVVARIACSGNPICVDLVPDMGASAGSVGINGPAGAGGFTGVISLYRSKDGGTPQRIGGYAISGAGSADSASTIRIIDYATVAGSTYEYSWQASVNNHTLYIGDMVMVLTEF